MCVRACVFRVCTKLVADWLGSLQPVFRPFSECYIEKCDRNTKTKKGAEDGWRKFVLFF